MQKHLILSLMVLLMLLPVAYGASVSGSVYDLNLDPLDNVIVEINSTPHQKVVSKEGSYKFEVPPGDYSIVATHLVEGSLQAHTEENLSIVDDGTYVVDLFTFPDFAEGEEILNELVDETIDGAIDVALDVLEVEKQKNTKRAVYVALIFAAIYVVVNRFKRLRAERKAAKKFEDPESDEELDELIALLKRYGGRMTQKDIRKELPHSEAKISLMITDLESKGTLRKIKKGRGNVVILNKK